MGNNQRLLFFDLLRIGSVALIVLNHMAGILQWPPLRDELFGVVGVAVLIFVSGAVLEYTHNNIPDLGTFYASRLLRIYPAYWMSLVIALAFSPFFLAAQPVPRLFIQFSGFNAWTGGWGGLINPCGWFIGLIVILYLVFPFISSAIRKYPVLMLVLIAVVEVLSKSFLSAYSPLALGYLPGRYLPICNFLEFGLGIWIVQQGVFLKWTYDNGVVRFLADISFYVFLIHLIAGMQGLMETSLPFYLGSVGLLSWMMMVSDRDIQKRIRGNTT